MAKFMHYVEIGMGVVLIIVGILLFSGRFERLARFSSAFFSFYDEIALGAGWLLASLSDPGFLGLIPAFIAYRKGHSFWTWWLFGATLFRWRYAAGLDRSGCELRPIGG